jgi:hypothetical protein
LSKRPDAPTLAPAGTEAHLLDLRSTAGSCFGRFILFSHGSKTSRVTKRGGRAAFCAALPNRLQGPSDDWNQRARQPAPIKRRTHASSARRHRSGLSIAINCGKLLRSFHLIILLEWFKDCPAGGLIRDVPPPAAASLAVSRAPFPGRRMFAVLDMWRYAP